jgi:predicted DNA-binding WGR domain protein
VRIEFRSDKRGYVLDLERDLLGAFVLYRRWYGLNNRRGGMKQQVFLDEESAVQEFKRIETMRGRRGYVAVHRQSGGSAGTA